MIDFGLIANNAIQALIFALIGLVIFMLGFKIMARLSPADLWKEIMEDQNTALGVLMGAMSLGLCIIIAAAIH